MAALLRTAGGARETSDTSRRELSPRDVARAMGVSESSLKRWCDQDLLRARRTAGGHRRIQVADVVRFMREQGIEPVDPDILGLPTGLKGAAKSLSSSVGQLYTALAAGDAQGARAVLFSLHLAGHAMTDIGDQVIAPVFWRVGKAWERGELEVYQERRAHGAALRALHELGAVLPEPGDDAPLAIGGTLEGDPYSLATTLVELSLRQAGWRAVSLGAGLPAASLAMAVRDLAPSLLWISASHLDEEAVLLLRYEIVQRAASELGVTVVVGGQALGPELRQRMRYTAYCDTLAHLESFVESFWTARLPGLAGLDQL